MPVAKYLERYADPVDPQLALPPGDFGHLVIIPSRGEGEDIARPLTSMPSGRRGPVAVVLVVNAQGDAPDAVHEANRRSIRWIESSYASLGPSVYQAPFGPLVVLDATLAPGQGVGHARKLGCDFALRLWAAGRVASPWLHCPDADVAVPKDMFDQIAETRGAAALYPFWHEPYPDNAPMREANASYEIKLRYYVLGLRYAGSPYAFHTIGSTMAIDAKSYAAVRGFPKKNAAEDFYLLNKLAKVGAIERLCGSPIEIRGRVSDRVPFGTGRSIGDRMAGGPAITLYDPAVFDELRRWLVVLAALADEGVQAAEEIERRVNHACDHPDAVLRALSEGNGVQKIADNLARGRTAAHRKRNVDGWFDAFRTLRMIHVLRDAGRPNRSLRDAIDASPFVGDIAPNATLDEIRRHLADFEQAG